MIYYKLDKNIDGSKLLQDIQKLITKISNNNNSDLILVISVQKIINYSGDSLVPKLTGPT